MYATNNFIVPKERTASFKKKHCNTESHKSNLKGKTTNYVQTQLCFKGVGSTKISEFERDLVNTFAVSDISLFKLENPNLQAFFIKLVEIKPKTNCTIQNLFLLLYILYLTRQQILLAVQF